VVGDMLNENPIDCQTTLMAGAAGEFLEKVLFYLKKRYYEDLCSIILFGSHAIKQNTKRSDIDLLIVMKDTVDSKTMRKIARNLNWLTFSAGIAEPAKGLMRILRAIEAKTGISVCYFLCHRQDFIKWRFSKIFGVNQLLAKLLAPGDLVRVGIQTHGITLEGEDLLTKIAHHEIGTSQLAKSCLMNIIQAMGALLIAPLSSRATFYSLEAVKWSLFSSYAYLAGKGGAIAEIVEYFRNELQIGPFLSSQLDILMQLRESLDQSPKFSMKAPLSAFLIHKKVFQGRKREKEKIKRFRSLDRQHLQKPATD
jgi:predicted nucleotidyltransferase